MEIKMAALLRSSGNSKMLEALTKSPSRSLDSVVQWLAIRLEPTHNLHPEAESAFLSK